MLFHGIWNCKILCFLCIYNYCSGKPCCNHILRIPGRPLCFVHSQQFSMLSSPLCSHQTPSNVWLEGFRTGFEHRKSSGIRLWLPVWTCHQRRRRSLPEHLETHSVPYQPQPGRLSKNVQTLQELRTNFLVTTYKLPEIPGSLYVRTNLLKFQEACTYTYKLTKISVSLYVRTNLLNVQTYSNI